MRALSAQILKPIYRASYSSISSQSSQCKPLISDQHRPKSTYSKTLGQEPRFNPLGIEMLPDRLYKQVFGDNLAEISLKSRNKYSDNNYRCDQPSSENETAPISNGTIPNTYNLKRCIQHLQKHDLLPKQLSSIDTIYEYHKHLSKNSDNDKRVQTGSDALDTNNENDILLDIPKIEGANVDEHFNKLGEKYSHVYKDLASYLVQHGDNILSQMPKQWVESAGWTRYEPLEDGSGHIISQVDYPLEQVMVFDVETCLNDTVQHAPTIAVAFTDKAWYSWVSPRLKSHDKTLRNVSMGDLIPFKSTKSLEKLVIGHNVGFDRSFLSDQYDLSENGTKFLDTLSLHMCICGLTRIQRTFKMAQKRKNKEEGPLESEDLESNAWIEKSSLNNLADVYHFHCGQTISKDDREIFIKGSMDDVRDNFQSLVRYCANDVRATFEVFKVLFATFNERFPHSVTLAGMLEMSTMYLPVNTKNWQNYIESSQNTFEEYEERLRCALQELADQACSKSKDEYSNDVWLWDIDWSTQSIVPCKNKQISWRKMKEKTLNSNETKSIDERVEEIYETKAFLRVKEPFLPGFPKWYRDLCCPPHKAQDLLDGREWRPGPCLITTQMRITPKLMQLTWDGYPLHHHPKYGWGYLVPDDDPLAEYIKLPEDDPYRNFPIKQLKELCRDLSKSHILMDDSSGGRKNLELERDLVQQQIENLKDNTQLGTINLMKLMRKMSKKVAPRYKNEYCEDVVIPGAYFIRLPHKNGPAYNVGNPLSKDFLSKSKEGVLSSFDNELAKLLLTHSSSLSYWKNSHKRIKNQMVVGLPNEVQDSFGAILPRVIVAGTVTRRAVEPTWLTASNQDTSRIGSELKAMVQAPPGYCFVGADVDSQELWIASLMGDSYSYKIHGGTGLSYMTLRGSKSDKTDMHSKTASLIGISRSDAKVLNYARIYGAGQKFIERFLINTNHHMTPEEAKEKAKTIFKETKGVRKYYLKSSMNSTPSRMDKSISIPIDIQKNHSNQTISSNDEPKTNYNYENSNQSATATKKDLRVFWEGGTESATFNKLEEIASSSKPRTPVLDCQISQALEPDQDHSQDFVTSRVNWVVQSSAVDFLHLVLVNMKWLFERLNINGRFSISIHDEVRYIVDEKDRYKAAFALQVSNLLVRAYFAYKLNMKDLPISVAFFSSVDIDKCLRKEVDMDCRSPSNPNGLNASYGIGPGESLDVEQILKKYTYQAANTFPK